MPLADAVTEDPLQGDAEPASGVPVAAQPADLPQARPAIPGEDGRAAGDSPAAVAPMAEGLQTEDRPAASPRRRAHPQAEAEGPAETDKED